jgi:hypothetical protein
LPLRGWILLGSLLAFAVAVLSVLAWAQFTGRAGSQRGLVIHNELSETVVISIGGEQETLITPDDQEIFVIKRDQFPTIISWESTSSITSRAIGIDGVTDLGQQEISYAFLVDAEFRISIDENGVYPTTDYRDTPVAGQ